MATPRVEADTVEVLLENARWFWKEAEDLGSSLNTRGASLVAFGAIILSLIGVFHQSSDVPLDFSWSNLPPALAIAALLFAVLSVIFGVLIPTQGTTIATPEIEAYPTFAVVTRSKTDVQGTTLRGLVQSINVERRKNGRKARWLKIAYVAVAFGLLCVTVDAIVVASQADDRDRDSLKTQEQSPRSGLRSGATIRSPTLPNKGPSKGCRSSPPTSMMRRIGLRAPRTGLCSLLILIAMRLNLAGYAP